MALLIITATGLRSWAWASRPSLCASSGRAPPPAKGSRKTRGSSPMYFLISALASSSIFSLVEFSHFTSFASRLCSLLRSLSCSSSVGKSSGWEEGSSTREAQRTARAVARGRRAHQRCSVEGCPWRMLFSLADSALMASSGRAVSISFLGMAMAILPLQLNSVKVRRC